MSKSIIAIGPMAAALTIAFTQTAIAADMAIPTAGAKVHTTFAANKN